MLVAEAYEIGGKTKLEPTLILAIMAVESSFNPFAQSHVGAQGLMQVMTRVHGDKYESAGGILTAFQAGGTGTFTGPGVVNTTLLAARFGLDMPRHDGRAGRD